MTISGPNGVSDVSSFVSASLGTSHPLTTASPSDAMNAGMLGFTGVARGGGTGFFEQTLIYEKKRVKTPEITETETVRVALKLEAIDSRLSEYMRRIDQNIEHANDMTQALLEAGRKESELFIEANREKTELLLEANRNETILKIETNKREAELLIRSIKESSERTETRFREDNEKAEARIERLAREIKESNNRIHGYALANVVGFASLLAAIAILVWSVRTMEFPQTPAPTVNINQTAPAPAPAPSLSDSLDYDID
ncbi:MAG: hypothetical protein LBL73_12690 [Synergistaceae bacterium]|jgi:hypothetical protein|nr:hypothetical protein [Synergistaceae bacterium]